MNSHPTGGFFLPDVLVIRVTGEKAAVFLNGQFTNDIKNLKSGEANYNLFLTQKGKIIADLTVHRVGDDFLLLIPKPFVAKITEHLSRLAPLSRVSLMDETERCGVVHVLSAVESNSWFDKLTMSGSGLTLSGSSHAFAMNRIGVEGMDWIVLRDEEEQFFSALEKNGISKLDTATQEITRVENGIARVGIDATEDNLPQEVGLMRAISLTKGCYLGQEVVARLHYRGHVNRILVGLRLSPSPPPSPARGEGAVVGQKIFLEDKEVGKITSAVFSPTLNAPLALGYVPYAKKDPGNEFLVGSSRVPAVVVKLPLQQRSKSARDEILDSRPQD